MENMTILKLKEAFKDKLQVSKRPELTMNRLAIYHSEHLKGTRSVFVKFFADHNYVRSMDNYPDLKMFTGCFNLIEYVYYIDIECTVKEEECQPADQISRPDADDPNYWEKLDKYIEFTLGSLDQLVDQIGCWSIDTIELEHEWDTISMSTYNKGCPEIQFNEILDSLENNQTIYVALRGYEPHLLFTNDVYVMRDNLLPYITHLYVVQEIGNTQPAPQTFEGHIEGYKLSEAEFQNKHKGKVGTILLLSDQADYDTVLSKITTDVDSGREVWYKLKDDKYLHRLRNPRSINADDLKIVEKIMVIPSKNIPKDEEKPDFTKRYPFGVPKDPDAHDLFNMKLHDLMKISTHTNALRVPGGWLYATIHKNSDAVITVTFVPLNNEFI